MRFAYADPPYIGCAKAHYSADPNCAEVDHVALIAHLVADFPDGWALSCHTPSLRALLPLCPENVRVGAWVKPFASWKPSVHPAFAWEPVLFCGGRKPERWTLGARETVRDFVSVGVLADHRQRNRDTATALLPGVDDVRFVPGAKPRAFCEWLFGLLSMQPGDELVDLFPGSGAVGRAWEHYCKTWDGALFSGGVGQGQPAPVTATSETEQSTGAARPPGERKKGGSAPAKEKDSDAS